MFRYRRLFVRRYLKTVRLSAQGLGLWRKRPIIPFFGILQVLSTFNNAHGADLKTSSFAGRHRNERSVGSNLGRHEIVLKSNADERFTARSGLRGSSTRLG